MTNLSVDVSSVSNESIGINGSINIKVVTDIKIDELIAFIK